MNLHVLEFLQGLFCGKAKKQPEPHLSVPPWFVFLWKVRVEPHSVGALCCRPPHFPTALLGGDGGYGSYVL